jgi:two-component system cell cycle sensor histidine kinase PleC
MLNSGFGTTKHTSLIADYSALLGDAILRHRTRVAEHSARVEAELASRVKSEFIATMSHELRTPLNTVIGFSKILGEHNRRRLPDGEVVEYARLIHDAAAHLLSVINDILEISKIQSGRFALEMRDVALEEVLQACVSSFRIMAQEACVTIDGRVPAELPLVRGDAVKLRQIFTNLVGNAVKFTPSGGTIALRAAMTPAGGVMVTVEDTGIGMTPDELLVALTPFGQVDGGRSRWREGTGLGLPIAKGLVELHGGTLEIVSEKGRGTRVIVILPRADFAVAPALDGFTP